MNVKISLSLPDDLHAFARRLVDEGRYPSMSAMAQEGLDLLREQIEKKHSATSSLSICADDKDA